VIERRVRDHTADLCGAAAGGEVGEVAACILAGWDEHVGAEQNRRDDAVLDRSVRLDVRGQELA
jgi:hypothetical protein